MEEYDWNNAALTGSERHEEAMSYPLFDSGFILWSADLDSRLMELHGRSTRQMGLDSKMLLQCYYGGGSVASALTLIEERGIPAR